MKEKFVTYFIYVAFCLRFSLLRLFLSAFIALSLLIDDLTSRLFRCGSSSEGAEVLR